ncbi:hypothetical protein XELAEV_18035267mg [Xenopus laevis]|uniref:Uncharacterized protein n=1 Tax=Xenopus laevis TaxID=8355 RepID=A0A974CFI8_XENLA|nr:hypothetical protein XELAEV_18035267mg [Xenopus laevis]
MKLCSFRLKEKYSLPYSSCSVMTFESHGIHYKHTNNVLHTYFLYLVTARCSCNPGAAATPSFFLCFKI